MSTPDQSSPFRDGEAQDDNKPRLTEEQKRRNHITSEQKRRQAIRDGFDKLAAIVPGLEGQGRSEGHVLNGTVKYLLEQIQERKDLIAQVEARGGIVDDKLKDVLSIDLSQVNLEHIQMLRQRSNSVSGGGKANAAAT